MVEVLEDGGGLSSLHHPPPTSTNLHNLSAAMLQLHGNGERAVTQRDERDRACEQQPLELEIPTVWQLQRQNDDDHLHGHAQCPQAREDPQNDARRADRFDSDQDDGEDDREWEPDVVQKRRGRRNAALKLGNAVEQEHAAHCEAHEEGRVGGESVHEPSGWMAWVTGPLRRASVRTSRAPNRLMITSRPRCGSAPPNPATSTKHSPVSGRPCRTTCPPWHTSAAAMPRGPTFTIGGCAGFNPAALAAATRTPASPCASVRRVAGMPPRSAKTCSNVNRRSRSDR